MEKETKKIIVSWDIANGGNEWCVQFWKTYDDGKMEFLTQLDRNSDECGNFELTTLTQDSK